MKQEDYGISLTRAIGIVLIISCHILQFFGNELAWWLNCGVQLFLGLSGFIYGQRVLADEFDFIKKRFVRILKDYYICIGIFLTMYWLFATQYLNFKSVMDLLFCSGTIEGLGHLWFVGTILFCYLLTPLMGKIFDLTFTRKTGWYIFVSIDLILLHIIVSRFIPHFQAEWVVCYFVGFVIGRVKMLKRGGGKRILFICLSLCVFMNGIQIYVNYISHTIFQNDILQMIYIRFCNYAHVVLGLSVFLICYGVGNKISKRDRLGTELLKIANEYSYDIFLVHNIWLNTSPFCIWNLNTSILFKVILIFIIILIESFLVHWLSGNLNRLKILKKNL